MARIGIIAITIAAMMLLGTVAVARDHGKPRDLTKISAIVIHSVGGPACIANAVRFRPIPERHDDAIFWANVLKAAPDSDAHYVVGRTGKQAEAVPVTEVANHTIGVNAISIGIELVNRGDGLEPFGDAQVLRLIELIKKLRDRFPEIRVENIVRHSDIDQRTCSCAGVIYRRRQDPGANFPLDRILTEVRLPADGSGRPSSLPQYTGSAPERACVTKRS